MLQWDSILEFVASFAKVSEHFIEKAVRLNDYCKPQDQNLNSHLLPLLFL